MLTVVPTSLDCSLDQEVVDVLNDMASMRADDTTISDTLKSAGDTLINALNVPDIDLNQARGSLRKMCSKYWAAIDND